MYITADAILRVALTVERQAIDFYTRLQHRFDDALVQTLLREEKEHVRVFKHIFDSMSGTLARQGFENPYMDDALMATTFAEVDIFQGVSPDTLSPTGVLDAALTIEKNAVLFYSELIRIVAHENPEVVGLLREMLEEERCHLRLLAERKEASLKQRTG